MTIPLVCRLQACRPKIHFCVEGGPYFVGRFSPQLIERKRCFCPEPVLTDRCMGNSGQAGTLFLWLIA